MKAKSVFRMLFLVVVLSSLVLPWTPAQAQTIKIGHEVALTGPNATWGQSEANAVKMAVEKVNAQGGVLGRKLEIIAYDNRADRLEAVNVAKRLVEQDKVVAIIGPAQSGVANANPYDGIDAGKLNLWSYDNYHASTSGYYLEALVVFGSITGRDPRSLGDNECSGYELGLSRDEVKKLQQVAFDELVAAQAVTASPLVLPRPVPAERCARRR